MRLSKITWSKIKIQGICEIANDNAKGQIIISGDIECINLLEQNLKKDKKKVIPLNASAPFHCSLMKPAADEMKSKIEAIKFKKPKFDIICNVTSEVENDPEKIEKIVSRTNLFISEMEREFNKYVIK